MLPNVCHPQRARQKKREERTRLMRFCALGALAFQATLFWPMSTSIGSAPPPEVFSPKPNALSSLGQDIVDARVGAVNHDIQVFLESLRFTQDDLIFSENVNQASGSLHWLQHRSSYFHASSKKNQKLLQTLQNAQGIFKDIEGVRAEVSLPEENLVVLQVYVENFKTHEITFYFPAPEVTRASKALEGRQALAGPKPKIAIVIDDLGESWSDVQTLIKLDPNISLSVLPHTAHAVRISEEGLMQGYEVLLHVPMEPEDEGEMNVPNYLTSEMSDADLAHRLDQQVDRMPYIVGINNHMGSRLTKNSQKMAIILRELKARNLFFLDSRTTNETVGYRMARQQGMPTAMRDVFLDHVVRRDSIERQFEVLRTIARRKGHAIAIGHPNKVTMSLLKQEIPRLKREGFEIVPVTSL